MMLTRLHSPSACGVTACQVAPLSWVRCTRPSSVPAQNMPAWSGDSAKAKIVQYTSTPVWSRVIGPPEGRSLSGSLRVRSGLTARQLWPSSSERKTMLPQKKSAFGSCRPMWMGDVHWNRYL